MPMLSIHHTLIKPLLALLLVTLLGCGTASHSHAYAAPTPTSVPRGATAVPATIWRPALRTSWQWQLDNPPNTFALHVQVYDVDGFDTPATLVDALHHIGTKVICYIDVGTWENWRPDAGKFPASVLGSAVAGWNGERWLDIRQLAILEPLITARMEMCQAKGFDAIEPDNIDGYTNDTGFALTAQDQLTYNTWLTQTAHRLGLSIGLKNDLDQVPQLLPLFDWALDEQCFEYQECDALLPFIRAGKAVFEVEYNLQPAQFCPQANAMNFNSMKKDLQLDAYRVPCR
jgi:hypothetical protein